MDKRTLLALALMAIVLVVTPMLFPSRRQPVVPADSTQAAKAQPPAIASTANPASTSAAATGSPPPAPSPAAAAAVTPGSAAPPAATPGERAPAQTVTLSGPRAAYSLVNPGAVPTSAWIPSYRDLLPALHKRDSNVVLRALTGPLLHYRLANGPDTVALDTMTFTVSSTPTTVTFTSPRITLSYQTARNDFLTSVRGAVTSPAPGASLLIDLPSSLRSVEADTLDDERHLSFGFKVPLRDVNGVPFSKLDEGATRRDTSTFQWVSMRSKYWLIALMQPVGEKPAGVFHGVTMTGGPRVSKVAIAAFAVTSLPLTQDGKIAFDLYIGPQSWQELHALGNDLENVNPYAGWLHAVVQPFATIVMRTLLWMKATFRVNYGWVLVIFGVVIRLLLWPLNQKAMRTSIQMQRLQPELTEVQKRYKDDPEKQREALMKLYQSHGMSPLSPMLGCLPMMLPMPILFALYFVFQNTIEFRGVSFLWLPDISLRDPYYIIPIVMGASMFLLSWIGMRSAPPNPQTKMMSYMMPAMFTVMFLNFASGLNLYYAVQNIAALPQQWVVARERAKAGPLPAPPSQKTRRSG